MHTSRFLPFSLANRGHRENSATAIAGLLARLAILFWGVALFCRAPVVAQSPPEDGSGRLGQFVQSSSAAPAASAVDFETKQPFSATYVAADVASVINQMLGDFLKIDYSIAPDVSGSVTMRVEGLHSRLATIDALRTALRPLGIAVIDRGDIVAIAKGSGQDGPVRAAAINPGQPSPSGGGVVVLTPKHIAPSQLAPLIAPFAPSSSVAAIDDARRFLIVKGDEVAITAASNAAAMFDVDWFAQAPTASIGLKYISPDDLIGELRPLLGPALGSVDLIPIRRLSSIIVMTRSPETLAAVKSWITRLDTPSSNLSAGLLVYRAHHVGADALAKSLREVGSPLTDSVQSQPTAGQGPSANTGAGTPRTSLPGSASFSNTAKDMTVAADATQNVVIVRGDGAQLADAKTVLEALDQPQPQVIIEAAIVEVTLNNDLEFGVNWNEVQKHFSATFTDADNGQVASRFPGLSLTYVNADIMAAINVLSSITKVEVMSRPSVVALQNETAKLQVGDQVPITTQTAVSVNNPDAPIVNQTTYRDTGVILSVTPRVRAGGMVELEVAQEVSQVARTTSSGIDSPTIQQRKLSSKLLIPSGQSVALGGLISASRTNGVTGVPLLKDIPLLGQLFRTNSKLVKRTELIVFLTPRILADSQAATDATDQLRKSFRKLEANLLPHQPPLP
jgi:general secretion pathway protein D